MSIRVDPGSDRPRCSTLLMSALGLGIVSVGIALAAATHPGPPLVLIVLLMPPLFLIGVLFIFWQPGWMKRPVE